MFTSQNLINRIAFLVLSTTSLLMTLATLYLYREYLSDFVLDWYTKLGWVIVPLLVLTVLLLFTTFCIAINGESNEAGKNLLQLAIVTYAAPTVGFIGTIVGLQSGLTGFDNNTSPQELNQAVNGVVNGLTVSLSSTLVGGSLGLVSGLVSMLYRHTLDSKQCDESIYESPPFSTQKEQKASSKKAPMLTPQLANLMKAVGDDITGIRPAKRYGENMAYSVTAKDASVVNSIIERIKQQKHQLGLQDIAIKRLKSRDKIFLLIPSAV